MRDRRHPGRDEMLAAIGGIADQYMPAAIMVGGAAERGDAVLAGPVGLDVAERDTVQADHQRQRVRVLGLLAQIGAVLFDGARLFPEVRDRRVVHPQVETDGIELFGGDPQGQGGLQPGNVAPVHHAGRLGRTARMAGRARHDVVQRVGRRRRAGEPGMLLLPEEAGLGDDGFVRRAPQYPLREQRRLAWQRRDHADRARGRVQRERGLQRGQQFGRVGAGRAGSQPVELGLVAGVVQAPGAGGIAIDDLDGQAGPLHDGFMGHAAGVAEITVRLRVSNRGLLGDGWHLRPGKENNRAGRRMKRSS